MAPQPRKTNKHLPPRVYQKHGAYYFVDHNKKWHRLGKTIAEAMQKWATMGDIPLNGNTMNGLFDRYLMEVAPTKAETTAYNLPYAINNLRVFFGKMIPDTVTPIDIYRYMDNRAKASLFGANKDRNILSSVFTMAIRWGIVSANPCRDVKRIPEPKRERDVEDWERDAVYNIASDAMKIAMDFVACIALREFDILRLMRTHILEEGLKVKIHKTGKWKIFVWNDRLREVTNRAMRIQKLKSMYLLCTKKGMPYSRDGFKSNWQRLMNKAIDEKLITERFTFHDLRAKAAKEAEKLEGREYARELLDHTTQKTTAGYIRGIRTVKPLK